MKKLNVKCECPKTTLMDSFAEVQKSAEVLKKLLKETETPFGFIL